MTFPARPFSAAMKLSTAFVSVAPLAMVIAAVTAPHGTRMLILAGVVILPIFAWAVRQSPVAYEVRGGQLIVHGRLGGLHTYTLDGTVRYPTARLRLRLFGSSGFFGHTGWFLDTEGRRVRAFVSQDHELVSVGTRSGPVVLSPANPADFVSAVRGGTVR